MNQIVITSPRCIFACGADWYCVVLFCRLFDGIFDFNFYFLQCFSSFSEALQYQSIATLLLLICYSFAMYFIILAGTPPTTALAGTSLFTTAPAAIIALSPMVTPDKIVACAPIHTQLPI